MGQRIRVYERDNGSADFALFGFFGQNAGRQYGCGDSGDNRFCARRAYRDKVGSLDFSGGFANHDSNHVWTGRNRAHGSQFHRKPGKFWGDPELHKPVLVPSNSRSCSLFLGFL